MGDQLNDAIADLQSKYNFFANLQEERTYIKAVKEAIETLEGSGGGGGVTEQFVTDAVKVETDARVLADETLQANIDKIVVPDMTNYYNQTETNDTFITKVNGTNAIADLAPKSGLYKDIATPINLEAQCQSLETRVADSVTNSALAEALNTSTTFMVLDPSTSAQGTLDAALANIYVAPARQVTLSTEQMKQIEGNILAELLKKMAK